MAAVPAKTPDCLEALLATQNADGGWSYARGSSWTEPTVYALLALVAAGEEHSEMARKAAWWLKSMQREDGGLTCSRSTHESAWVTGLALLLVGRMVALFDTGAALDWTLTACTGRLTTMEKIRIGALGRRSRSPKPDGWSWTPETAAWVFPTSMTILGLQRARTVHPDTRIAVRVAHGHDYLRKRLCSGGGWNIGDGPSPYPETTGAALLAMRGASGVNLEPTLSLAERLCENCPSREARLWLALGLAAHGRKVPKMTAAGQCRGTRALALSLIADAQLAEKQTLLG